MGASKSLSSSVLQSVSSEASDSWSECDPLCRLPHEVLFHIFGYVPPRQLVKVCRMVCKQWRSFFDEPSFWKLRMKQHRKYDSKLDKLAGIDWPKLCLYTVHEPNLIKSFNANDDLSLDPWAIIYQDWRHFTEAYIKGELRQLSGPQGRGRGPQGWGGDGWAIEEWIKTDDDKDQEVLKANKGCAKNYVTSYYWCCRWQLVDLQKHGFVPAIMDTVQPPILVSEWFCARWDCGSIFNMKVALLNQDFDFVKTYECSEETAQWKGGELGWRKVKHIFRDYGPGVRYVLFLDGGKDTKWWAGHYGSKMAAANVQVEFCNAFH